MDNIKKAMEELGEETVKELIKQLIKADKKATGQLIKSIDYRLIEASNDFIVQIIDNGSLKWVDVGRRKGAKQPPMKALDKWVIARGIAPRDKKGRFIPRESVKFLIARSIKRNGIKPTNVIRKTIDEIYSKKMILLENALIKDIEDIIDKIKFE